MGTRISIGMKVTRSALKGAIALALAGAVAGCTSATPVATGSGDVADSAAGPAITISAASSLKAVLVAVTPAFEKAHNVTVSLNFGASGQLVKQIEGGAPVDALLAASPSAVATLVAESLASADTSVTFAGNRLAILVPKGNPAGIHGPGDLSSAKRITTGDPAVAPHGQKAQEWLTGLGLWESLRPLIVFTANAAQTDEYVAQHEVDAGIGFASDAHGRTDIEIAYVVPAGQIKPIRYVGALIGASKQSVLAQAYLDYLVSPEVQAALVDAGFEPAPGQ